MNRKTTNLTFGAATIAAVVLAGCVAGHAAESMPELEHPWADGLYSTITQPFCTDGAKPKDGRWIKLKAEGMRRSIWTRAVIQKEKAPLVVILNGTNSKADGPEASLWMSWLEEAGSHAFSFDSTFTPCMTKASGHGVAGCLEAEAELAGRIIQAFLAHKDIAGKVASVHLVGMSYGGTQALLLARMGRQGRLPFALGEVHAYSAPVSFEAAIRRLDSFFSYDWKLSEHFWTFYGAKREFPVRESFDPAMMKAALGRAFQLELKHVAEFNDRFFQRELAALGVAGLGLPQEGPFVSASDRLAQIDGIRFKDYIEKLALPYWKAAGKVDSREAFFEAGEMPSLLEGAGANVSVVFARNDPLNDEGAEWRLAPVSTRARVVVLPRGGHLGFVNSPWVRERLVGLGHSRFGLLHDSVESDRDAKDAKGSKTPDKSLGAAVPTLWFMRHRWFRRYQFFKAGPLHAAGETGQENKTGPVRRG